MTALTDSQKDIAELREISDWLDSLNYKDDGDFIRSIADGVERWAGMIDKAIWVLTPVSDGGDGGAYWWDCARARSILKGLGDPQHPVQEGIEVK